MLKLKAFIKRALRVTLLLRTTDVRLGFVFVQFLCQEFLFQMKK